MAEKYGKWIRVDKGQLGKGGQAATFLVVDEENKEKGNFVLKRLLNPNRIGRAKNEIEACQRLSHPNIVKIIDYDISITKPYIVTEYCEGGDLSKVAINSIPLLDRLRFFRSICQGVGYAHEHNIIHRDLKPDNIFLRDKQTPVVGDFGICFIDDGGERITLLDEAAGPRWFIAPELEDGRAENITPASDVYSLGKLLYWLISAGKIFTREKHREQNFDLTIDCKDTAILFVYELLDEMIVHEPAKRLANARKVAEAVEVIIKRLEINAHVINLSVPQSCIFCGVGEYRIVTNTQSLNSPDRKNGRLDFFHIDFNRDREYWLIMVCDYCGNTQLFRPDFARNREIWIDK